MGSENNDTCWEKASIDRLRWQDLKKVYLTQANKISLSKSKANVGVNQIIAAKDRSQARFFLLSSSRGSLKGHESRESSP